MLKPRHTRAALALLCLGAAAADVYDPASNQLAIGSVQLGNQTFTNVLVNLGKTFQVLSVGQSMAGNVDSYDPGSRKLTVANVMAGSNGFQNVVLQLGNDFRVLSVGGVAPVANSGNQSLCQPWWGTSKAQSAWAAPASNGLLQYQALNASGDHIMDFSTAGYMGGGVPLPAATVQQTVAPSGDPTTDLNNIQAAINAVGTLPLVNGLRGAVLLSPGVFQIPAPINLPASGVVLRGSGSGANGTVLQGVGAGHLMIQVGNTNASVTAVGSTSTTITDAYLPSGSSSFHVADTSKVQVGEPVWVRRRATSAWIHFMGMDTLVRSGNPQTWIDANNDNEIWRRTITAVNGNQVSLDQPLTDSFDSTYIATNGGTVEQYTTSGIVSQIGVEHLAMEGMPRGSGFDYGVINIDGASDAWMNDVLAHNFTSGVVVARNGSRITIESVQLSHDNNNVTCPGAKQFEFSIDGTQVLVDRSSSTGSMQAFYYATQGQTTGPNVLLNFTGRAQACAAIEPHQRWASGLLVDGANISGEIALGDRGTDGSGHGWSMGWGVVWNSSADALAVQSPPGATNWVIGSSGTVNKVIADGENVPSNIQLGTYDSQNIPVAPQSLYLAQLCQRLGPQALRNIGY